MKDLGEAIKHCEEKAKELKEEAEHEKQNQLNKVKMFNGHFPADYTKANKCLECAADHEQLAAWLKELKAFREGKANGEQEAKQYALGYQDGFLDAKKQFERPQGEREFIEIITQYFPDDIVTYPEYRGKPYYSIHYRENGEEFVGYGTYNPDVLSRYLRTYFFGQKGGAE